MSQRFVGVEFTDGRTTSMILFDPNGDTEESVARLVDKMAESGFRPIKGSEKLLIRDENGVLRTYTEERAPKIKPVWQVG